MFVQPRGSPVSLYIIGRRGHMFTEHSGSTKDTSEKHANAKNKHIHTYPHNKTNTDTCATHTRHAGEHSTTHTQSNADVKLFVKREVKNLRLVRLQL
jgi:hypothetical protein